MCQAPKVPPVLRLKSREVSRLDFFDSQINNLISLNMSSNNSKGVGPSSIFLFKIYFYTLKEEKKIYDIIKKEKGFKIIFIVIKEENKI